MSTFVKTFPGATTDEMDSCIVPTLKREPDILKIHCGTNDFRADFIALKSKSTVKNVAVSGILARGGSDLMEGKRLQVGSLLVKSLAENEIYFIRHQNHEWRYLLFCNENSVKMCVEW